MQGAKIKKILSLGFAVLLTSLSFSSDSIDSNPLTDEKNAEEIFEVYPGKVYKLQGEILNGRYKAPQDIFSCKAYNYGEKTYIAQDGLMSVAMNAAFYSPHGDSMAVQVLFMPGMEVRSFSEKKLKEAFDRFGINLLKTVDKAEGIEVLKQEMLAERCIFTAISIDKINFLRRENGPHRSYTRGYLIFPEKDKLVVMFNQVVTQSWEKHNPRQHIDQIKKDLLEFRSTFEYGPTPSVERALKSQKIDKKTH